eukprot:scaffold7762_cov390-Prasinococcus_capsulatus_cf.AAC.2
MDEITGPGRDHSHVSGAHSSSLGWRLKEAASMPFAIYEPQQACLLLRLYSACEGRLVQDYLQQLIAV